MDHVAELPRVANPARILAGVALAGVTLFAVLVAAQDLNGGHPVRDAISEYAVGDGGWVQTLAFVGLGTGEFALATSLWMASHLRGIRVVALLVAVGGVTDWTSALFETDLAGAPVTAHGQIHTLASNVAFFEALIAIVVLWRVARHLTGWRTTARRSAVAMVLLVVAFLGVIVGESGGWGGLAERFLLAVVLAWYVVVATQLRRKNP